ncbi:MAG TPA: sugar ABC transporter substrate-binding protein [Actinobacteria bacterium]|nr:sugar ABC transporter substrate-binding protein [Actinomycetota bacterium]
MEPVSIQLAIEASGDTPLAYQDQIDRFNESHKDVQVELRTYTGGDAYNQAILGQVAGGVAPDVFLVDGGVRTKEFATSDAIAPLTDLAKAAGLDLDSFKPSLLKAFTVDGKLYGIPKDYNTTALFYHKDLLEQAGIEPPKTWDDLRAAAQKLTSGDTVGFGMYPQINYFLAFIEAAGGSFVSADGVVGDLSNAGHKEALAFMQDLFTSGYALSPQMAGAGWDGEMFANKQVAMVYGGTWIPGAVLGGDPSLQIGAVPLPPKVQPGSVLYTAGWVISAKSEHPDAAMELISFLTSDEELLKGREAGIIGLPPTESALQAVVDANPDDPTLAVARKAADYGVPFGWLQPKFVDTYNKAFGELVQKKGMTPSEMIDQVMSEMPKG